MIFNPTIESKIQLNPLNIRTTSVTSSKIIISIERNKNYFITIATRNSTGTKVSTQSNPDEDNYIYNFNGFDAENQIDILAFTFLVDHNYLYINGNSVVPAVESNFYIMSVSGTNPGMSYGLIEI